MLTNLSVSNFRKFERYTVDFGKHNLLVGPNNAGKSTLIEALRLVSTVVGRARTSNFSSPPDWLRGIESSKGLEPSLRNLDFELGPQTFHHYGDPPAVISASFQSGLKVTVYIGPELDVFAVLRDHEAGPLTSKQQMRFVEVPAIGIQPQVGPLAKKERQLDDRYVVRSLSSNLAPIHFRNQLRVLTTYFERFQQLAESTWPNLRIDGLESVGLGDEHRLALFLRDGPFVAEAFAMGHGLQMWLQLMWFLSRASDDETVILDEPDVYMHPDLQRRLIRIISGSAQQTIVATHSVEMIAEVEPSDLVVVDSSRNAKRPARAAQGLERVVEQLGPVDNLELARVARSDTCVFAPSADLLHLERWRRLVADEAERSVVIPSFPCDDWDSWAAVRATKRALDIGRAEPLRAVCLLPGVALAASELAERRAEAAESGIALVTWNRRELASYLLNPVVIARTITGFSGSDVGADAVASELEAVCRGLRDTTQSAIASSWDATTTVPERREILDRDLDTVEGLLALVAARPVFLRLSAWSRREFDVAIGPQDVVNAFAPREVPEFVANVLRWLTSPMSNPLGARDNWPTWTAPAASAREQSAPVPDLEDLLELLTPRR